MLGFQYFTERFVFNPREDCDLNIERPNVEVFIVLISVEFAC